MKNQLHRAEIKLLRADARRATLIATHLRERANALAKELRLNAKTEQVHKNFYSKQSKIDQKLILTPDTENIFP